MDRQESFTICEAHYNALIGVPAMRKHLLRRSLLHVDDHYFIGTLDDYQDAMRRCRFVRRGG